MNYDILLNINTDDEDITFPTLIHHHRYEPTTYDDLKILCDDLKAIINDDDVLIDFGSGLMRVPIFIHYQLQIKTIGIEINKALFLQGRQNVNQYFNLYPQHHPIVSINKNVMNYQFTGEETLLFFFNPFSPQIFKTVISRFLAAASYDKPSYVILYYAKHDYIDIMEQFNIFHEFKRYRLSNYEIDAHDMMIVYEMNGN